MTLDMIKSRWLLSQRLQRNWLKRQDEPDDCEDDEALTNLSWLSGFGAQSSPDSDSGVDSPSLSPHDYYTARDSDGDSIGFGGGDIEKIKYRKPPYSYTTLISMAIKDSETGQISLAQIYKYITETYPYYATAPHSWQNSIRHSLSLNKCFKKVPRKKDQVGSGKGGLWQIDPEYAHLTANGFSKRNQGAEYYKKTFPYGFGRDVQYSKGVKRSVSVPANAPVKRVRTLGPHQPMAKPTINRSVSQIWPKQFDNVWNKSDLDAMTLGGGNSHSASPSGSPMSNSSVMTDSESSDSFTNLNKFLNTPIKPPGALQSTVNNNSNIQTSIVDTVKETQDATMFLASLQDDEFEEETNLMQDFTNQTGDAHVANNPTGAGGEPNVLDFLNSRDKLGDSVGDQPSVVVEHADALSAAIHDSGLGGITQLWDPGQQDHAGVPMVSETVEYDTDGTPPESKTYLDEAIDNFDDNFYKFFGCV